MDFKTFLNILYPTATLSGLGFLFGFVLAYASKKFEVKTDARVPQVLEALPGANCGGCGFAGCGAFAAAVVDGTASISACSVGGQGVLNKISKIMNTKTEKLIERSARVLCSGNSTCASLKYEYFGIKTCSEASKLFDGPKTCAYSCIGFGDCISACKFGAIKIENGIAVIDEKKCGGCGKCTVACPKNIIKLFPKNNTVYVSCTSKEKGAASIKACSVGCIACKICEKTCKYGAIKVVENCAVIDDEKCTNCFECGYKCPKNTIRRVEDVV